MATDANTILIRRFIRSDRVRGTTDTAVGVISVPGAGAVIGLRDTPPDER
jgi:hypothetical protein